MKYVSKVGKVEKPGIDKTFFYAIVFITFKPNYFYTYTTITMFYY